MVASPAELLLRCRQLLDADPVSTSVVATVATAQVRRGEDRGTYLWLEHDEEPVAVGVLLPGSPVALSDCTDAGAAAVAEALLRAGHCVAGASGPAGAAWAFVRRWEALTGVTVARGMAQGVYVCDQVRPPAGVVGAARAAGTEDLPTVFGWFQQFATEAGLDPPSDPGVSTMVGEGRVHLWLDPSGDPVSMVVERTSEAGMARLGPVWTPVVYRRRGYASALTAHVTATVHARGHRAMLFTDLDNATSNGIYQAIGYRRTGDAAMLRF